ncbi:uncharacterized protein BDV17DRAFT_249354 [Aspergillus undulatus]|uniref:uncharacterized protein n=1 Tax=Aspergillus undulatus TaxID=1810928 RepID=UPI003CCD8558
MLKERRALPEKVAARAGRQIQEQGRSKVLLPTWRAEPWYLAVARSPKREDKVRRFGLRLVRVASVRMSPNDFITGDMNACLCFQITDPAGSRIVVVDPRAVLSHQWRCSDGSLSSMFM